MLLVAVLMLIARLRSKQVAKEQAQQVDVIVQQQKDKNAIMLAEVQRQNSTLIAEIERLKANPNSQNLNPNKINPVNTFNPPKLKKIATGSGNRGVKPGQKRGSYKKK